MTRIDQQDCQLLFAAAGILGHLREEGEAGTLTRADLDYAEDLVRRAARVISRAIIQDDLRNQGSQR
jgi:hypothetical protein